jgi:acetyl esterase/lipase
MNGPPDNREIWVRGVAMPEVHVFRPARPDGSSLLSIPGGGYGFLSVQNEGIEVAERFNAEGTTVFVLTYRLPGEGWTNRALAPLQDAQRAMRLIRSRAADFRIDPARLGILGFSPAATSPRTSPCLTASAPMRRSIPPTRFRPSPHSQASSTRSRLSPSA